MLCGGSRTGTTEIKESILSEFEYGEIDDSLQSLFPEKRIIFKEVISEILTGNLKASAKLLSEFVREQMFYLLQTGKKNLIHILLIAMIAAFMNQFAGTLQNRQVASVGFYMIYMLLAALTVAAFDVVLKWVESGYGISLLLWEYSIRFIFWRLRWRREV